VFDPYQRGKKQIRVGKKNTRHCFVWTAKFEEVLQGFENEKGGEADLRRTLMRSSLPPGADAPVGKKSYFALSISYSASTGAMVLVEMHRRTRCVSLRQ
jgi:hypothetical protein